MYPRVSVVCSSPGSAAAPDLSGGTGSFFSIDKRRHLLAGKGATFTDRRYLLAEKGGISAQEPPSPCWRNAAACNFTTRYFSGFLPVDPRSAVDTLASLALSTGPSTGAAAKTSGLGSMTRSQRHRWKQTEVGSEDYVGTHFRYMGGGVGFVDSAKEKNKARAVVEIYRTPLKRGRYHRLPPLSSH